jgi:hypothetical protein
MKSALKSQGRMSSTSFYNFSSAVFHSSNWGDISHQSGLEKLMGKNFRI